MRQGRPKESVTTTARRVPKAACRAARSRRAEASGSSGSSTSVSGRAGVGGVDAGVGAHVAVPRAADQPSAVGAQELGRLVEDDLDVARVLAVREGELRRTRIGCDVAQAP
jgi:hypothetical protein